MELRHLRLAVSASLSVCVCSEWLALEGGSVLACGLRFLRLNSSSVRGQVRRGGLLVRSDWRMQVTGHRAASDHTLFLFRSHRIIISERGIG